MNEKIRISVNAETKSVDIYEKLCSLKNYCYSDYTINSLNLVIEEIISLAIKNPLADDGFEMSLLLSKDKIDIAIVTKGYSFNNELVAESPMESPAVTGKFENLGIYLVKMLANNISCVRMSGWNILNLAIPVYQSVLKNNINNWLSNR